MSKKKQILLNGIILALIFLLLLIKFIMSGIGAAQVVILAILAALSGFQFWIYFNFFHEKGKK